MAYTNKTPNYGLPQYLGTDKASWLDFNEPFNTVDLAIKENAANADSAIAVSSAAVNTANTASDTANSSLTKSNEALVHATSAENNANTALEKAQEAIDTIGTAKELKEQVEANTANIATNTTDIASIEEDLASVKTDVAANTTGVAELKAYNEDSETWRTLSNITTNIQLASATSGEVDGKVSAMYKEYGNTVEAQLYILLKNVTLPAQSTNTRQTIAYYDLVELGDIIKQRTGVDPFNEDWRYKCRFVDYSTLFAGAPNPNWIDFDISDTHYNAMFGRYMGDMISSGTMQIQIRFTFEKYIE